MQKTFKAPAKINLCLHVLGRLPSGYHELAMAMQRVDLYDTISIRVGNELGVRVECAGVDLPAGGENIAARAARALLDLAGIDVGVDICIDKKIPVAAGLGGGSSDAATVLLGLNEMLGCPASVAQLLALGGELGADVPFFVFGQPAWATGVGTTLEPLPVLPAVAYLLINPRITVSTADVYRSLRLTKGGELANLPRFSVVTKIDLQKALYNDLESVTLQQYPVIAEIKQRLLAAGALGALMSGSGSTVFGVFDDFETARRAGDVFAAQDDWLVFPVHPL
ncbi:4-diphosphocytidyl-2-C-methyl-D-erythritol kinase [Desulfuromusa kysingii]|uniref:4-diphosphocytidyl-2-C-methyl-D-erythritol kinase n=1 Tax=Desulfuromusa kysingii TaxID=37625 RepID=A0A1H3ZEY8_9BACT|nr:4-(cytidine 5'-diphospho)-2-C-methyl-D-erythritol kinase [Desulfuromusa kysingii]SEA22217.1 4-diphosphocytidyl-2-C-methyl-D-erythritol kinase [Desulfuromusa kysingii]